MLDALNPRRYLIPFRSLLLPQIFCDTLIIGGGVAGLRAAISAAEDGQRLGGANFGGVIVLAKDEPSQSNTAWAQGGIAAVTGADDTIDGHVEDTLVAGAGLCDEPV
ncbi:MAG: FAD-binding protein, partial [Planctomyces sp.]